MPVAPKPLVYRRPGRAVTQVRGSINSLHPGRGCSVFVVVLPNPYLDVFKTVGLVDAQEHRHIPTVPSPSLDSEIPHRVSTKPSSTKASLALIHALMAFQVAG